MSRARGFSVPELLLVLLIVGIVGAAALASWPPALQRARRAAATAALLELALRQEQHLARHGQYATDTDALGWPASPDGGTAWPDTAHAWYRLRLRAGVSDARAQPGYTAVAQPLGMQALDRCGSLGIDHVGRRYAACADAW